jgi:hypothetical protein
MIRDTLIELSLRSRKTSNEQDYASFMDPAPIMDQRLVCANPPLFDLTLDSVSPLSVRWFGRIAMDNSAFVLEVQKYQQGSWFSTLSLFRR